MATIELEAPKGKKVHVVMVEYEHRIPWHLNVPSTIPPGMLMPMISPQYRDFLVDLIKNKKPAVVCEELGLRDEDEFWNDNPLVECFKLMKIPYVPVDISENARFYLESTNNTGEMVEKIQKAMMEKLQAPGFKRDEDFEQLVTWYQYLSEQAEAFNRDISLNVREGWFTMGLLDQVKKLPDNKVTIFMITDAAHFEGLANKYDELGFTHEQVQIERKRMPVTELDMEAIQNGLPVIEIKVKNPKKSQKLNTILYFMDTDDYASPFDINMAYDAGFDVVVPLPQVTAEKARKLTEDAMFSRGPDGANFTAIMVGGSNVPEAEKVLKIVQKSMFPPFQLPVFADPRGGYTTAAAAVVKTVKSFQKLGENFGAGTKVAILGCGPVGRTAAMICSSLGCEATLVETAPASAGFSIKNAEVVVKEANEMAGLTENPIKAAFADNDEDKVRVLREMEAIIAMGAAGFELVSQAVLESLENLKVVSDINAVPPTGISGVKASMNDKPHKDIEGLQCNGALAIGVLKRDTEYELLKAAKNASVKNIYGWREAFEKAAALALKEPIALERPVEVIAKKKK